MQSAIVSDSPQIPPETADARPPLPLTGCRVLALLNSIELFGHEKGNIEVFKALRSAGADIQVGINAVENGGDVGACLREFDFATFTVPFGCQWSKSFFRRQPSLIAACGRDVLRSSLALRRKCRHYRPTHVHLGNALAYSYVAPALAASRVPMVFRVGDEPPTKSRPNLWIWKRCFAHADVVVANSEFVRRRVLDACPNASHKLHTIYNLAPLQRSTPSVPKLVGNKRNVLFVGQIAEHKGVIPLVDAAIDIVSRFDVIFDLVGGSRYSGDLERSLRAKIEAAGLQDKIRFHGHVKDPSPFYAAAALHVAPSVWEEPAANVVLEAKRAGTPSVVFPSGGLPELVRHQVDGFVCYEKSAEALREGIRWFLDCPKRLSAARAAALNDHAARFGPTRFVAQWSQVYLDCKRNASTHGRPSEHVHA